jgi:hypothetical protein
MKARVKPVPSLRKYPTVLSTDMSLLIMGVDNLIVRLKDVSEVDNLIVGLGILVIGMY